MNYREGLSQRESTQPEGLHELSCMVDTLGSLAFRISANKHVVLGIGGYTAMGKTTLAHRLAQRLVDASVFSTDSFMLDRPKRNGLRVSGDDPRAIDFEKMSQAIEELKKGNNIQLPQYNHVTGLHDRSLHMHPSRFLIVEGTASLYPQVGDIFSLRIFLDADLPIRKLLTMQVETGERGYTIEEFESTWNNIYLKEHAAFIEPTKSNSDVIIAVNQTRKYSSEVIDSCVCN